MPEYEVKADIPPDVDACVRAYLECAEWCGLDENSEEGLRAWSSPVAWDSESIAAAQATCDAFRAECADVIALLGLADDAIGHDLWLTQNRHGAGFWDRGHDPDSARTLTDAAHGYGERFVEMYDDRQTATLRLIV